MIESGKRIDPDFLQADAGRFEDRFLGEASSRVRMEGLRQRRALAGGKTVTNKKNRLDTDRPSRGRRLHSKPRPGVRRKGLTARSRTYNAPASVPKSDQIRRRLCPP